MFNKEFRCSPLRALALMLLQAMVDELFSVRDLAADYPISFFFNIRIYAFFIIVL